MYDAVQLNADASGYGVVQYVARGSARIYPRGSSVSQPAVPPTGPLLAPKVSETFLNELYALVWTTRPLTIYRFYGTDATATASVLGAFWTPARPSLRIDRLGYESMHDTSRDDMSLKRAWNPMAKVVEANLSAGAHIYVGRVAPQTEMKRHFGGGAIQFFAPALAHRLHIKGNHDG